VFFLISFKPFWSTLKTKGISTYALIENHGISSGTIHRLKHDKAITTTKLDDLCEILDCEVEDIVKYIKKEV